MERNTPQHKVDAFRAQMTTEQRGEFDDFCRYNRNTTAIRQLLEDWGFKVSQSAVQNWYRNTFPVGQQAKQFNLLTADYNGVEISDALQKLLILNANLIDRFVLTLKLASTEEIRLEQLVTAIPSLSREVRACAAELQQLKYVKDKKELEMSGAYRAIQELKLIFKDSAFEQALEEAARSVMARLEGE